MLSIVFRCILDPLSLEGRATALLTRGIGDWRMVMTITSYRDLGQDSGLCDLLSLGFHTLSPTLKTLTWTLDEQAHYFRLQRATHILLIIKPKKHLLRLWPNSINPRLYPHNDTLKWFSSLRLKKSNTLLTLKFQPLKIHNISIIVSVWVRDLETCLCELNVAITWWTQ